MSDPVAILLVPSPEHVEALLGERPYGSRPPRVECRSVAGTARCPHCKSKLRYSPAPTEQTSDLWVCDACKEDWYEEGIFALSEHRWEPFYGHRLQPNRCALVLAGENQLVFDGLDRVVRHFEKKAQAAGSEREEHNCLFVAALIHRARFVDLCNESGGVSASLRQLGSLILVDLEGREVGL
jgi:hypothetical protein